MHAPVKSEFLFLLHRKSFHYNKQGIRIGARFFPIETALVTSVC